jgi:hypothetical protein
MDDDGHGRREAGIQAAQHFAQRVDAARGTADHHEIDRAFHG